MNKKIIKILINKSVNGKNQEINKKQKSYI